MNEADRIVPAPLRHLAEDCCYLTTIGRRSGTEHRVEIWFAVSEANVLYLIAGHRERCDWLRNADVNPAVTVEVGDDMLSGVARRVTDPSERHLAGTLMTARYPGFGGDPDIELTQHEWRWEVPVLAIEHWTQRART